MTPRRPGSELRRGLWLALLAGVLTAGAQTNAPAGAAKPRDPFWPVGYAPPDPQAAAAAATEGVAEAPPAEGEKPKAGLQIDNLTEQQQAAIRQKLKVSGIMRFGPDYVARINGQLVGAGDEVTVELEGQRLMFLVRTITKDAVQMEPKR